MGCDIHAFVETRRKKDMPWSVNDFHTYTVETFTDSFENSERYIDIDSFLYRNYYMFGLMADVRGGDITNLSPKGLPVDLSDILREEVANLDYHSHSWLSVDEFKRILDHRDDEKIGPEGEDEYDDLFRKMKNWLVNEAAEAQLLGTGFEPEIRLVFWFDN